MKGRTEGLKLLGNLDGQLSRGREDESVEGLGLIEEALDDGKGEGARLSGTGLR